MVKVFSDLIQFRGSHYQFGYLQGERLKDSILLKNREAQWQKRRKHQFETDNEVAINLLDQYAPGLTEEIQGLADALDWSFERAVQEFSGYYVEYERSGCSIMTGTDFFVRNYDSHPSGYEGRLLIFQPNDGGYATIGPSMQITGRMDGMNEKGLAIGYNFTNRIGSADGFVCNMIGRILLETCTTVDQGIALLKSIPHRTSFSYVLFDQKGDSVVVEASPRTVIVRPANMCTNHFELLHEENRYKNDESIERLNKIKSKWRPNLSLKAAYQTFNQRINGIFSDRYSIWSGTLHTSLYQPETLMTLFGLGADQMPVRIDLGAFLQGETIRIKCITGKLKSDTPFINDRQIGKNK
ncbi:C45 family autoproteolytic acyltransferase/hydrolase [Amphibacillus sp. Q70]|uniref:C45 family autoproteolytic acyltransferase/hydolase n=1 Tax=Amphibacillus sp. Q70 TaxID=3453416 RepID=UPI003F86ECC5